MGDKISETDYQKLFKQRDDIDILKKMQAEAKSTSKANRLKIVNCFRTKTDPVNVESEANYTVVEVESVEPEQSSAKDEVNYVYDIYCSEHADPDFSWDNLESVEPWEELIFADYRTTGDHESDDSAEDSNDENNWRNEYPDSDIDDDEMLNAIKSCKISNHHSDDNYLSSSDDEDVYHDVHYQDTLTFGKKYAQFKARVTHDDEDDIDDDEYYSDQHEYGIDRDEMYDYDAESD